MVRRFGRVPATLYVISRSDPRFAEMLPLNTEAGQWYIDDFIIRLGGVDFIFFDNIQALTTGVMKEEDSWSSVLPWIRSLTNREIGQLWVHHTGHDDSRAYGTKTREWQLDYVLLLEKIDRPEADIAFTMKFTKARERAPHNRPDFEPMTITLMGDAWAGEPLEGRKSNGKVSPLAEKFYAALADALATAAARRRPESGNRICVTLEVWTRECVRLRLVEETKTKRDSMRAMMSKYRLELIAANRIACNGDFVWSLR